MVKILKKFNFIIGQTFLFCLLFGACGSQEGAVRFGTEFDFQENESGIARTESEDAKDAEIMVYVCGEVNNPGVYCLKEKDRIADALFLAGGFTENADTTNVNLAGVLKDGQRIYFPPRQEDDAMEHGQGGGTGLVNINTADEKLLCTLPGIGEAKAKDIIAYREENGGFDSCEDIMKVPGIKAAAYGKIEDLITVY